MSNSDDCPVAVKPLEWVSDKHQPGAYIRKAATPVGTYEIGVIDLAQRTYYLNTPFKHHHSPLSFDAATTVAQADYEQRIRSALAPVAAPVAAGSDEVVEQATEAARAYGKKVGEGQPGALSNAFAEIAVGGAHAALAIIHPSLTADKAEIARLTAEVARLDDELTEEKDHPWPEWAEKITKMVREYSGYDGFDDAEGVDLPQEVDEALSELADIGGKAIARAEASETRCAAVMAERDGMAEALKPFAAVGAGIQSHLPDDAKFPGMQENILGIKVPTIGDFRRAALEAQERTA